MLVQSDVQLEAPENADCEETDECDNRSDVEHLVLKHWQIELLYQSFDQVASRFSHLSSNAEENIAESLRLSLFIPDEDSDESGDLEHVIKENSDRRLNAERGQCGNISERADEERENLRHRSCSDRRTDFSHAFPHFIMDCLPFTRFHS